MQKPEANNCLTAHFQIQLPVWAFKNINIDHLGWKKIIFG
jgi:hypothetical protein